MQTIDMQKGQKWQTKFLSEDKANDLRGRVCGILRKSKLPQDNLSKQQRKATVLMKGRILFKLTQLIQSGTYRLIKKDPTKTQETKICRILKNLEREGKIPTMLYNRLRPTGCRPPLLIRSSYDTQVMNPT